MGMRLLTRRNTNLFSKVMRNRTKVKEIHEIRGSEVPVSRCYRCKRTGMWTQRPSGMEI